MDFRDNSISVNNDTLSQSQAIAKYMAKVYSWMVSGLAITAITAWFTFDSGLYESIYGFRIFLMLGTLGLVWFLSSRIESMNVNTAVISFLVYSFLNGLTFSIIFAAFSGESISSIFGICAAMFGALSIFGFVTKKDLSGVGTFMFMGLVGIIIASIVNIFFINDILYLMISILGVFIFAGLTAYDTQKIKESYTIMASGEAATTKLAIMGALSLYLDFINLFIFLLRIFGNRR